MRHRSPNFWIVVVILISFALGSSPTVAQGGGRPILLLTENGQVVVKIVGPKGATDVEIFWGGPGVPEGGYGYWTMNGKEIPKSRFAFLANINDVHFSPTGRVPRLPPTQAPPGANDIEIRWEGYRIVEAWWTRDGERLSRIPLGADTEELNFQFNREKTQQAAPATATTQLVGVVFDPQAGKQQTMSVTNDPNVIAEVKKNPVLLFVPINFNANVPRNASGQVDTSGIKVILPNEQQVQLNPSGTTTFTLQAPTQVQPTNSNQSTHIIGLRFAYEPKATPLAQVNVPLLSLSQREPITTVIDNGTASAFTTPPVVQNGSLSFISGPFSNNGSIPLIRLDGQPVSIIAGSDTRIWYINPPGTSTGQHQLIVQDGARSALFPISTIGIGGTLGKPTLVTGEQTTFSVIVKVNADSIPDSVWQNGGGISPELANPAEIQKAAPSVHIPQAGEQGGVLLVVSNGSPGVVKINEVVRVLHKQDFKNNQFTTGGEVQSLKGGGFVLNLLAANLFKPIPGREARGGVIAGGTTVPGPTPKPV